jgi:hypothetical protein
MLVQFSITREGLVQPASLSKQSAASVASKECAQRLPDRRVRLQVGVTVKTMIMMSWHLPNQPDQLVADAAEQAGGTPCPPFVHALVCN